MPRLFIFANLMVILIFGIIFIASYIYNFTAMVRAKKYGRLIVGLLLIFIFALITRLLGIFI